MLNNRILLATKQIKKSNYLRAIPRVFNLLCLLVFYFLNQLGTLEALLSLLASSIIINIIYFLIITKSFELKKHNISKKSIQSLLKYGVLFAITGLVMNLNYEFDIILLERYSNFNEIGIYKMGINFTQLLQQIPMAITPLLMIRAAHSKNIKKNIETTLSFFRISMIVSIIAGIILYFLAEILIPFFYGADFLPSTTIVHIILPGILFLIAFSTLSSQTAGSGKPLYAFYSFLPALIINIVLNILWIPEYGGVGAAWASNISYFTGLVVFLIIFVRYSKIPFFSIFRFSKKDFYALRSMNHED
jgi:O-antigen/teichoic acid export membrane protein